MFLKLRLFLASTLFLFFVFSYKENSVEASIKKDVPQAKGPVKFTFSLSTAIPFIHADIPFNLGYRGDGSYVVIIDTGVEKTHPFLKDKVALEACFSSLCPNGKTEMIGSGAATPVHFHGTHVAGIVAGYNSDYHGVAPDAKIIAVNVFDPSGSAYDDDIIKALNWVYSISDSYNISSVNMSLGGTAIFNSTCDNYIPDLTLAIKNLKDKNIATVVAAGNAYALGMSSPACISYAVSVAAVSKTTGAVADFSNISTLTTFGAPGTYIVSSKLLGTYGSASGTSMAAPFVSGAFALYRSKFGTQTVDKTISDLKSSSKLSRDIYTNISISRIDFESMFAAPSETTTTISSTTTAPISSTTTTVTTTPISTTTTTTTIPVVTTSSTTTSSTTLPPPAKLPIIPKPLLLELNGMPKSYVWVKYRDPYMNKSFIDHYKLFCNNKDTYIIPKENMYSLHSYKLEVLPSNINFCYIYGVTIYGTKTANSSIVKIYPKNKSSVSILTNSLVKRNAKK